jgi:hypothetical protein
MPFPVSPEYIAKEEERLGVSFPDSLKSHLLSANGGEIVAADETWQLHGVLDTSDRKRAARSASHIARETGMARQWRGFPPTAVAIASNGSGDVLVLLPSENDAAVLEPAVYLWNHETAQLEQVALDFMEFSGGEG